MAKGDQCINVATITQDAILRLLGPEETYFGATIDYLDRAAVCDPDIACLPEVCSAESLNDPKPETVPGPTTERVSQWARQHSCYVVCPVLTREGERMYNSAVLIDRSGEIAGRYNNIHPDASQIESGICPGDPDPPVFETDFGIIGIQICFDVNFPETWSMLREKGAQAVFFPAGYSATRQLQTLAWRNEFFIVSSTKGQSAKIIDISGDIIAFTNTRTQWINAPLHLGKRLFETDFNAGRIREAEKKYGRRIKAFWYDPCDWVTLESRDPEISVKDLIKEYDLSPLKDYIARCEKKIDETRAHILKSTDKKEL